MPTLLTRPTVRVMTEPEPPTVITVPAAHRQRFTIEVIFYHSAAEITDCVATPVGGQRVVLYGGDGPLPAALAELTDRVVRLAGVDPLKAAVLAHAGLADGDTLTVLLPHDWAGPPPEVLLDHARRWFSSPHSSEDDVYFA